MGSLNDHLRRAANFSMGKGYRTSGERKERKAARHQSRLDAVYAGADMPDEELIRRNERRKAAKRRGSRQRNVLTDEDTLG